MQAIKSNPRTATIPILMYTSQEGELYLGQARALGALGVLPKQVAPVDVDKVLRQLHLTDTAPQASQTGEVPALANAASAEAASSGEPAEARDDPTAELPLPPPPPPPPLDVDTLREELAGLRRHVIANFDHLRERLALDLPPRLREVLPPPPLPPEPQRNPWPWAVAAAAAIAALALAWLLWGERQHSRQLAAQLAAAADVAARATRALGAPLAGEPGVSAQAAGETPRVTVIPVPFGEAPLAGMRVERVRELIGELASDGRVGTLEIRRFAGRFCLTGDRASGFSLAEDSQSYRECDLVTDGDSVEIAGGPAESLAFANLLADARRRHPQLRIVVQAGGAETAQAYPDLAASAQPVSAGAWNAAANVNNRVEVRWLPGS